MFVHKVYIRDYIVVLESDIMYKDSWCYVELNDAVVSEHMPLQKYLIGLAYGHSRLNINYYYYVQYAADLQQIRCIQLLCCVVVLSSAVQGMTLNCIYIFIITGSFLYWCVMRPASQRFFIHSCIYLRILIISYLATFLGSNSLSVLICRKAVN